MPQTNKVRGVHTSIRTENGDTVIRYHDTDVVRFNVDHITLNMGGWDTNTTRLRMTQAARQFGLEYSVYRKNGVTRVAHGGIDIELPTHKEYVIARQSAPRIYRIVRFRFNAKARTIRKNVTLAEAQAHCQNPATSSHSTGPGSWFDGYDYMPGCRPDKD